MKKSIYLAGSMTGLTFGAALQWRDHLTRRLNHFSDNSIDCYSPMRFVNHSWSTPMDDESVIAVDPDESAILGSQRGLSLRDRYDVANADLVFVNLFGATRISQGTLIEVGMAAMKPLKPMVLFLEKDRPMHNSPMLYEYCQIHVRPPHDGSKCAPDEYHEYFEHWMDICATTITSILCPEIVR